jgi:hypothetical protein
MSIAFIREGTSSGQTGKKCLFSMIESKLWRYGVPVIGPMDQHRIHWAVTKSRKVPLSHYHFGRNDCSPSCRPCLSF